jgi:glycosyltransferase 2 family protein
MLLYIKWMLFVIILAGLAFFIAQTDLGTMQQSFIQLGWRGFGWVMLITFAAYFVAAIGWKICLPNTKYNLFQVFIVRQVGEVITLINPTGIVGGEAAKWALMEKDGSGKKELAASIMVARIILIYTQLFCFVAAYLLLYFSGMQFPHFVNTAVFLLYTFIILLVLLLIMFSRKQKGLQENKSLPANVFRKYLYKLQEATKEALLFFREHPKRVFHSSVMGLFHWVVGGLEIYFILQFLGISIDVTTSVFVDLGVVFFKTMGVLVPGQIGIEEWGNKTMLETTGIQNATTWIVVSLIRRARQLCWIGLGLLGYFFLHPSLPVLQNRPNGNIIH